MKTFQGDNGRICSKCCHDHETEGKAYPCNEEEFLEYWCEKAKEWIYIWIGEEK